MGRTGTMIVTRIVGTFVAMAVAGAVIEFAIRHGATWIGVTLAMVIFIALLGFWFDDDAHDDPL